METEFLWHATGGHCLPSKPVRGRITQILRHGKTVTYPSEFILFHAAQMSHLPLYWYLEWKAMPGAKELGSHDFIETR